MTHGSLFSGIGGFDLAAEWMGWENKFHCEWNQFGQKVLKYYWPESELFTDITKSDFTKYANQIDVLTGGFPCQPYSMAGKRLGKEDDRHLWPEMLRVIREVKPRWVVGENVLGLVNWNGGLVFHEVQTDLEAQGYEVFPYVLPAVSVNAPHRRDRVWFVAYSNNSRNSTLRCRTDRKWKEKSTKREQSQYEFNRQSNTGIVANSKSKRSWEQPSTNKKWQNRRFDYNGQIQNVTNTCSTKLQGSIINGSITETRKIKGKGRQSCRPVRNKWCDFPSVSPVCNGDDGLSDRLDSITFSKWRSESIKAGGNAIVPQVVYQIFKTIELYEHQRASDSTSPGSM